MANELTVAALRMAIDGLPDDMPVCAKLSLPREVPGVFVLDYPERRVASTASSIPWGSCAVLVVPSLDRHLWPMTAKRRK